MKKLKCMSLLLGAMMVAGTLGTGVKASAETVNLFQGGESVQAWSTALSLLSTKDGGSMDTSEMDEDGYFYLEYTGSQYGVQLILQSWSGGASWVQVNPSEVGTVSDDVYYAKFNSDDLKAVFGANLSDALDQVHVWSTTGEITVNSLDYITTDEEEADEVIDDTDDSLETYLPIEDNIKTLGRTYSYNNELWCSLSGSGAEFNFTGTEAEVTLLGDSVATSSSSVSYARVAIYVNDELAVDTLITDSEVTLKVFESDEPEDVDIKIVKLSEAAMSAVGIKNIKASTEDGIKPAKNKSHYIEFVGDSITCGYGVDDEDLTHSFSTATENVTKTYAYKTAKNLDADYSMVSYSGYGVISACTSAGVKTTWGLLPDYYDKVGFSYGNADASSLDWNFDKVQPDLVVINLGTNDSTYCTDDEGRLLEFQEAYVDFIKQIREKNPNAEILCTVGIMGDSMYTSIENAVAEYTSETSDTKVTSMKFDVQSYLDGFAVDYHPTEKTHTKAADKLTSEIKEIMGW